MADEKKVSRRFFDSTRVCKAVGIRPLFLNKLVELKRYGIEPSVRAGEGRGSRRFFSEDDVYGIALVWWLFEAGLRSETIQYVFDQICRGRKKSTAVDAAFTLLEGDADILAIKRQPRISLSRSQPHPKLEVILLFSEIEPSFELFLETLGTQSLLFIPIETLFENLKDSMQKHGVSVEMS
jgi:hypothetical protein